MFRGDSKRIHVDLFLGYLCDCIGSEDSRKNILLSHLCNFCIYIIRDKIEVCGTIGGEVWKAEVKDSSKLIVFYKLDERWFLVGG